MIIFKKSVLGVVIAIGLCMLAIFQYGESFALTPPMPKSIDLGKEKGKSISCEGHVSSIDELFDNKKCLYPELRIFISGCNVLKDIDHVQCNVKCDAAIYKRQYGNIGKSPKVKIKGILSSCQQTGDVGTPYRTCQIDSCKVTILKNSKK